MAPGTGTTPTSQPRNGGTTSGNSASRGGRPKSEDGAESTSNKGTKRATRQQICSPTARITSCFVHRRVGLASCRNA